MPESPHRLVLGGTRSGKTYFVKKGLIPEWRQQARIAIFDPKGRNGEYGDVADCRITDPDHLLHAFNDGHRVVRYPAPVDTTGRDRETLEYNAGLLDDFIPYDRLAAADAVFVVLIEEAKYVQNAQKVYSGVLSNIMSEGAGMGVIGTQVSQASTQICSDLFRNVGWMHLFRMKEVARKLLGNVTSSESDIKSIPQYHHILSVDDVHQDDRLIEPI